MEFRPENDFVLVHKCIKKDAGKIILTQTSKDTTNLAMIVECGPLCRYYNNKMHGGFVQCPEFIDGMHRVHGEYFAIREDLLMERFGAVIYG